MAESGQDLINELKSSNPETSRRVYKETIADPQQRLAKLQVIARNSFFYTISFFYVIYDFSN